MAREPLVLDGDLLDTMEELLDVLAEGYGINAPSEDDAEIYEQYRDDLKTARP